MCMILPIAPQPPALSPDDPVLLPPLHAPIPDHAILWRVARPRPSAIRLLVALQRDQVPVWVARTPGPADRWTLYLWAPGHHAALLDYLVAELPSGATAIPASMLPTQLRWQCLPLSVADL